jgi:CubicO group peptidase (beta-lactamase class C family)
MTAPDPLELQAELDRLAKELDVPGAMAGIVVDGVEHTAFTGVTSVTNPQPVNATTLFQFGSTGKTFTATAVMALVEQGRVELDAPVRRYVPELVLQDAEVAERVTVQQLLNHTAGWEGDGKGGDDTSDASLATFVAAMAELRQETPLGATVSYNNAALSLAGRVVEKVTGRTFEDALRELVLDPLGLDDTLFIVRDVQTVMTRRFAVGHALQEDGTQRVTAPWGMPRGSTPAGGMVATLADQLTWARFHLGEIDGPVSAEGRVLMQQPTVSTPGSALGDHVGLSWLLKDVDGRRLVSHGGTTIGQYSDFVLVPELGFGFTSLTNSSPGGPQLNHLLTRWALERCCGIVEAPPEPRQVTRDELDAYTGTYETIAVRCEITADDDLLTVAIAIKPGALGETEDPGPQPPIPLALTVGDQYVVPSGAASGMTGYFTRSADGRVDGVHLGGRLATRTG